jgi:hypothetical protein
MGNDDHAFFQGGAAWLMSRHTAGLLWDRRKEAYAFLKGPEDWSFSDFAPTLDISIAAGASEFFLGQYVNPHTEVWSIMKNGSWNAFPDCMEEKKFLASPAGNACARFLGRWNRIVFLHRISGYDWPHVAPPVYECPDEMHWWMSEQFPVFCMKRPPLNHTVPAGGEV